jgi:SSS family solute:Na+ symporter
VTCVFVLGIFWRDASAQSAKWPLWLGSLLGAAVYVAGKIGSDGDPLFDFLQQIPFRMKAFYLLCACVAMQVVFSLIWPVEHTQESTRLYWSSPLEPLREKGWPGIGNYKLLSLLLIGTMVVLYSWFR